MLAFVAPEQVDLIGPIPQVLSLGFHSFGWVSILVSITIFGMAARQIALMSIYFAGNTRLPMVAGWDNLLPDWFSRLHKRYRTPVNSILFVGVITLAFSLIPLIGVLEEEAFQIQDNAATMFYALIYIVLFAIPLVAIERFGAKAPLWLKIASVSGLIVSLIAVLQCFRSKPWPSPRIRLEGVRSSFAREHHRRRPIAVRGKGSSAGEAAPVAPSAEG